MMRTKNSSDGEDVYFVLHSQLSQHLAEAGTSLPPAADDADKTCLGVFHVAQQESSGKAMLLAHEL